MRDRASVNDVAMRTISVIYNQMLDVGCFYHALDRVGERMKTPILDEFSKVWISLFAHSPKTRLAWRTQTGLSTPTYSATKTVRHITWYTMCSKQRQLTCQW